MRGRRTQPKNMSPGRIVASRRIEAGIGAICLRLAFRATKLYPAGAVSISGRLKRRGMKVLADESDPRRRRRARDGEIYYADGSFTGEVGRSARREGGRE